MSNGGPTREPTSNPVAVDLRGDADGVATSADAGAGEAPGAARSRGIDWRTLHLWQIQSLRDLLVLLVVVGVVYIGWVLSLVTVPLLLAVLLAYLFEPLVQRVTRGGYITRQGAAVGLIVGSGLVIVVPVLIGLAFGLVQGASAVQRFGANVQLVVTAVEKPDDPRPRDALQGTAWLRLADQVIAVRKEAARRKAAEAQESLGGVGAGGGGGGVGAKSGPEQKPAPGQWQVGEPSTPRAAVGMDAAQSGGEAGAQGATDARAVERARLRLGDDPEEIGPVTMAVYNAVEFAGQWVSRNREAIGRTAFSTGVDALNAVVRLAGSVTMVVFGAMITAFFFYFICTGWGRVLKFWESLIPDQKKGRTIDLVQQMDRAIAGFVRGRLTIVLILSVYYTVGYWLIGVSAPLVLGPVVGLLTLVPYAAGLGMPVAVLLMFLDPPSGWQAAWWWMVFAPMGVNVGQQLIDDYLLTPWIQGEATGMDSPTILFASIAGGLLAGFYGLLIAIPVAACVKILLREVFWPQFRAWAEGRALDPLPISRK